MMQENVSDFKQNLQKLIEVNKRDYLHGDALAIGKSLSEMLLCKNGLAEMLMAFEELAGDSFWQNTPLLTLVIKLLSKKPAKVKAREKYYAFILREFFILAKQPKWTQRFQLLFPLVVEEFQKVSAQSIQVQIVDRLLHPFETIVEQANSQKESTTFSPNFDCRWNESCWMLFNWLNALPSTGPFPYHERLTKMIPLWICMLDQALTLNEQSNTPGIKQFCEELETIVLRVLSVQPIEMEQMTTTIVQMFVKENLALPTRIQFKKIQKPLITFADEPENDNKFPHYGIGICLSEETAGDGDMNEILARLEKLLGPVGVGEDHQPEKPSTSNANDSVDALLANLDKFSVNIDDGDEMGNALLGHHLIEAGRILRSRDVKAFSSSDQFERLFNKLTEFLEYNESYVFLAAINALTELVFWQTDRFLGKMIALFKDWRPSGDVPSSSDDSKSQIVRSRIGEALAKIARELGDFSAHYFDTIASTLFTMAKDRTQPLVRASALSTFADLMMACQGWYFDRNLHELLLLVNQTLRFDESELARRAAIHLLRSMITSAANSPRGMTALFEMFTDSLAPITRQLRHLHCNDLDDVVRLHSELALAEIEEALHSALADPRGK